MMYRISSRDRLITWRVLEGEPCYKVAQDYAVCSQRIRQITLLTAQRLHPDMPALRYLGLKRLRRYHQTVPLVASEE